MLGRLFRTGAIRMFHNQWTAMGRMSRDDCTRPWSVCWHAGFCFFHPPAPAQLSFPAIPSTAHLYKAQHLHPRQHPALERNIDQSIRNLMKCSFQSNTYSAYQTIHIFVQLALYIFDLARFSKTTCIRGVKLQSANAAVSVWFCSFLLVSSQLRLCTIEILMI